MGRRVGKRVAGRKVWARLGSGPALTSLAERLDAPMQRQREEGGGAARGGHQQGTQRRDSPDDDPSEAAHDGRG